MNRTSSKTKQLLSLITILSFLAFGFFSCDIIEENDEAPYPKDQYESNDSRGDAAQIELATDIAATIFPVDDLDYYKVTTANTGVWDRVEFSLSNVSEGLRVRMAISDEDGVQIASSYAANKGAGITLNIETQGGTYYVKVESFHSGDIGAYTLHVKNLDNNDIYAPNDSSEEAYDLGILPAEGINGIIAADDEEDWFKIQTENSGVWDYIEFELTNVSSDLRAQMFIYNEAGNQLTSPYAGTGGQSLKYTLATPGGVYYIRIKRFTGTLEAGEYTLNVKNLHANDDYAPNQSINEAYDFGALPITDLQGTIIMAEREDWYEFKTINDNPIVVNLINVGSELRPVIRLTDGTTSSTLTTGSKGSNIIDHEFTGIGSPSQPIEAGKTYYFRVSSFYNTGYGDYTLNISQ